MNIYAVVEGPVGEKRVYSVWAPLVNPSLTVVETIEEVAQNNLYIVAGCGYPKYFDVIEDAIRDVSSSEVFDRLVIAVDSEEMQYQDKKDEINEFVLDFGVTIDYRIIIQHFCLETWGLGNRAIVKRNNCSERSRYYRGLYDVLTNDPELLPELQSEGLTRSQFAERYLRCLLNDKFRNLTYSKKNPMALLHPTYFYKVRDRFQQMAHISSFNDFLNAFV